MWYEVLLLRSVKGDLMICVYNCLDDVAGGQANCAQADNERAKSPSRVQQSQHCGLLWQLLCKQGNLNLYGTHGRLQGGMVMLVTMDMLSKKITYSSLY